MAELLALKLYPFSLIYFFLFPPKEIYIDIQPHNNKFEHKMVSTVATANKHGSQSLVQFGNKAILVCSGTCATQMVTNEKQRKIELTKENKRKTPNQ